MAARRERRAERTASWPPTPAPPLPRGGYNAGMSPTITVSEPWAAFVAGPGRERLAREALAPHVQAQRWFPAKARRLARLDVEEAVPLDDRGATLLVLAARYEDGERHRFAMPVAIASGEAAARLGATSPARVVARLEGFADGVLHDDLGEGLGHVMLEAIAGRRRWAASRGALLGEPTAAFARLRGEAANLPARQVTAEQSNTSVVFGDRLIMKLIRRLEPGLNPDYEVGRHLTEVARFSGVPALAGAILWHGAAAEPIVLAIAQAYVAGAAPLREPLVRGVAAFVRAQAERADASPGDTVMREAAAGALAEAGALGRRTGALHLALADARGDEAFAPEPVSAGDLAAIAADMQSQTAAAVDLLGERLGDLPRATRTLAASVPARKTELLGAVGRVAGVAPGLARIRVHGDLQLDQVLVAGGEFVVIDFEGEPLRPLAERRAKFLALKDVAGMIRSYSYAAYAGLFEAAGADDAVVDRLEPAVRWWQRAAGDAFVAGYRESAAAAPFLPLTPADFDTLLEAFVIEKATYELRYELNHRPAWLRIPLRGVAEILERTAGA